MPHRTLPDRSYRLIVLALAVPCVLLLVPAALIFRAEQNLAESFHWVTHTLEVETAIERLQRLLLEAESGQRGFLLTGEAEYLQPYLTAIAGYETELRHLRELTIDNPRQQKTVAELTPAITQRVALIKETTNLQESGQHDEAVALVATGRGRTLMNKVRHSLEGMADEEQRLLVVRQQRLAHSSHFATALMFAVVAAIAVFAVTIFLLLRRISRLQGLVTVCAWSRTVEYQGEWLSFEEYLLRRFNLNTSHGISPAEAEKTLGAFRASKRADKEAA